MSVQVNQYLCYGYLLDYKEARNYLVEKHGEDKYEEISDDYHDSAFKKEIKEINGCSMIEDGMNGKYTFFGKIFTKSENYEHLQTTVIKKVKKHVKLMVDYEFKNLFGDSFLDYEPSMILLTHYR